MRACCDKLETLRACNEEWRIHLTKGQALVFFFLCVCVWLCFLWREAQVLVVVPALAEAARIERTFYNVSHLTRRVPSNDFEFFFLR